MTNFKPCPPDFMEVVNRLKRTTLVMAHYGCGQMALYRWAREHGHSFREKTPAPSDLAENALYMTRSQLAAHYGVTDKIIRRMLKEANVTPMRPVAGVSKRAMPDDFASMAPTMTAKELGSHYRVSYDVLRRWLHEAGVKAKNADPRKAGRDGAAKGLATKRARGMIRKPRNYAGPVVTSIKKYHNDVYDIAADKLRRLCPVHRCDERGVYSQGGDFWRVGWAVLTPDELLEKARKMDETRKMENAA